MRGVTITISASRRKEVERRCIASAGPRANITGMRKLYWGKNAVIYKVGQYIYLMSR